jgi:hypothetical protein
MKTLKLQLLAASLFTCATAFAQAPVPARTAPATATGLNPTVNNNTGTAPGTRAANQMKNSSSDSRIDQLGSSQHATVNQTSGPGAGNTADVYQLGGYNNTANQTQTNTGATNAPDGRNIARVDQLGNSSTSDQTQSGYGNTANVLQRASSDNNSAVQNQSASSSRGYELIEQSGNNNYGYQMQTAGQYNKAEIVQTNNGNTADQRQSGDQNQAYANQAGGSYSLIQQSGAQNQGFVTQK